MAVYLRPFRSRFEPVANCDRNPKGGGEGIRVSSSFAFESRRRKNGKIIAPLITHDNAAMVITGKRKGWVGGWDEWESLFTDSGRPRVVDTRTSVREYLCVWPLCARLVMHGRNGRHTSVIGPCSVVG